MAGHSKIGASSMERWANCPKSVQLSEGLESHSSKFAAEGTAAHLICETALLSRQNAAHYQGGWVLVREDGTAGYYRTGLETVPPDSYVFTVDQEMVEAVQAYLNAVRDVLDRENSLLFVERGFHLSDLHPDLYGTSDAVIWLEQSRELHVFDYKHGQGKPVEVTGNPQLRYYGLGALLGTGYSAEKVFNHVVQPRCYHPDGPHRVEELDAMELLEFAGTLLEAVERTEDPEAPLVPGDWCRWCPAAAICPKVKEEATRMAQQEFRPDLSYDPDELAETLDFLPVLEAWIKNVREFAYDQAEHGNPVPGHKLVEKRATRKWRDEDEAAQTLLMYVDESEAFTEPKLKSPAQIEKTLNKADKTVLEDLITAESSGHVLVPESDKRPAVKASAEEDFSNVAE